MALELRPNCENCNRVLPPASAQAMICSFECTFCRECVDGPLQGVCPNCGGGFCARPIRPAKDWKGGNFLGNYPASAKPKHRPVDLEAHARFAASIREIPATKR